MLIYISGSVAVDPKEVVAVEGVPAPDTISQLQGVVDSGTRSFIVLRNGRSYSSNQEASRVIRNINNTLDCEED